MTADTNVIIAAVASAVALTGIFILLYFVIRHYRRVKRDYRFKVTHRDRESGSRRTSANSCASSDPSAMSAQDVENRGNLFSVAHRSVVAPSDPKPPNNAAQLEMMQQQRQSRTPSSRENDDDETHIFLHELSTSAKTPIPNLTELSPTPPNIPPKPSSLLCSPSGDGSVLDDGEDDEEETRPVSITTEYTPPELPLRDAKPATEDRVSSSCSGSPPEVPSRDSKSSVSARKNKVSTSKDTGRPTATGTDQSRVHFDIGDCQANPNYSMCMGPVSPHALQVTRPGVTIVANDTPPVLSNGKTVNPAVGKIRIGSFSVNPNYTEVRL